MAITITFEAGSTTTVTNFTLIGEGEGSLLYLQSSVPGTQYTLSKSSGTVTASYLAIQDSNATGGAYWDALNGTNLNLGDNTGWNFPYVPLNYQFFMFF
jgi:hypothetical protein